MRNLQTPCEEAQKLGNSSDKAEKSLGSSNGTGYKDSGYHLRSVNRDAVKATQRCLSCRKIWEPANGQWQKSGLLAWAAPRMREDFHAGRFWKSAYEIRLRGPTPVGRRSTRSGSGFQFRFWHPRIKFQGPAISLHRSNHSEFCFSRCLLLLCRIQRQKTARENSRSLFHRLLRIHSFQFAQTTGIVLKRTSHNASTRASGLGAPQECSACSLHWQRIYT